MKEIPEVTAVRVVNDYVLHLTFKDGVTGNVDLSYLIGREQGVFKPLNDPHYFRQVHVDCEAGTIAWSDELDLAPEPLYMAALGRAGEDFYAT